MNNPFEVIDTRLSNIETLLLELKHQPKQATPTDQPPGANPFDGYIPRTDVVGKLATATTLWRWEKQGKLKSYGIGGKRFYKRADIEQLFTEIKKGGSHE